MSAITVVLADERLAKLREVAANFGVSPEDLVRVSVEELLTRTDKAFQQAMEHTLAKNEDLYKRLA